MKLCYQNVVVKSSLTSFIVHKQFHQYSTVVPLLRDYPSIQKKVVSQKRWSSTRGSTNNILDLGFTHTKLLCNTTTRLAKINFTLSSKVKIFFSQTSLVRSSTLINYSCKSRDNTAAIMCMPCIEFYMQFTLLMVLKCTMLVVSGLTKEMVLYCNALVHTNYGLSKEGLLYFFFGCN